MNDSTKLSCHKAHCGVPQCNVYQEHNVSMHSIPRTVLDTKSELKKWKIVLKMGKPFPKYFRICSKHFKAEDILRPIKRHGVNQKFTLKKDAFPCYNLPKSIIERRKKLNVRAKRLTANRLMRINTQEVTIVPNNMPVETDSDVTAEEMSAIKFNSVAVQCEPAMVSKSIQVDLEKVVFITMLWDTDRKLNTKTGIRSFKILETMIKACEIIEPEDRCSMSLKNRILLTMHKLKSNCSFADIEIDFQISHKSAKQYFIGTIRLLARVMNNLIYWQTKEENVRSLPIHFQTFPDVMTVLDCTEMKTITFRCLKCRTCTYSHYKGGHTLKVLIGVSPSGLINFISPVVGGKSSDKAVFNLTDLIKKVKPGEAVMVDKGFMIGTELSNAGIEMIRPDFLFNAFSKSEVETNTQIASARVHIERRIGRIKIFKILSEKVPLSVLPYMDDIMTVICAISNLSPPILSNDKFM